MPHRHTDLKDRYLALWKVTLQFQVLGMVKCWHVNRHQSVCFQQNGEIVQAVKSNVGTVRSWKCVPSSYNNELRLSDCEVYYLTGGTALFATFCFMIILKNRSSLTPCHQKNAWTVRAIDNFVYMMTSSKWRPGAILKKLYLPQNFVPVFLSTVVWFLESQSPGKRTDRASIQSNQKWRWIKCVEEFCIRSRTAAPKVSSDSLTCYEAKGNLR